MRPGCRSRPVPQHVCLAQSAAPRLRAGAARRGGIEPAAGWRAASGARRPRRASARRRGCGLRRAISSRLIDTTPHRRWLVNRHRRHRRWADGAPEVDRPDLDLAERHDTRLVRDDGHPVAQRPGLHRRRPRRRPPGCHRERNVRPAVSVGRAADRPERASIRARRALRDRRGGRRYRLHDAARGHAVHDVCGHGAAPSIRVLADRPADCQDGAGDARDGGARCRRGAQEDRSGDRVHVRDVRSTGRGDGDAGAAHRARLRILRRARAALGGRRPVRRRVAHRSRASAC